MAGNVFYLLAQLAIISALSHFRGPGAVGQLGLALALTTPLFFMSNMGLRTAQAVDVADQFSFAEYSGVRVVLTSLAFLGCAAIGLAYAGDAYTMLIILIVSGAKAFDSISNLAYGAFQQVERMDLVARSYLLRGGISVVAFLLLLFAGADIATALFSQLLVWAAVGLLMDYPVASRLVSGRVVAPRWSAGRSWRLIWKSAPLSGAHFANSLQDSIPKLIVQQHLGIESLGIFTAIGYFQRAGIVMSNSVTQAIVNRLARLIGAGDRKRMHDMLVRLFLAFMLAAMASVVVFYWFSEEILHLLFGKAYVSAAPLLVLVSITIAIRLISALSQAVLIAQQRFAYMLVLNVGCLLLAVGSGYFFIPMFGILGAGYMLIAVALFRLLFLEIVVLVFRPKPIGAFAQESSPSL
jgi:O-antigen/teichoic acid export membrane protein